MSCLSICPHKTTQLPPDEFLWMTDTFIKICQEIVSFVKIGQKCKSTLHGAPQYVYNNISMYYYRKDRSFRIIFYTEWQYIFHVKYMIFLPEFLLFKKLRKPRYLPTGWRWRKMAQKKIEWNYKFHVKYMIFLPEFLLFKKLRKPRYLPTGRPWRKVAQKKIEWNYKFHVKYMIFLPEFLLFKKLRKPRYLPTGRPWNKVAQKKIMLCIPGNWEKNTDIEWYCLIAPI